MTWQPLGNLDIRSVAADARKIEERQKDPTPLSLDELADFDRAFALARQAAVAALFPAKTAEADRLAIAIRHAVEAGVPLR